MLRPIVTNKKQLNIAILNEAFLSQKHLEKLRSFGNVKIFDNTNSEELAIKRLTDVDVAIVDQFWHLTQKES